MWLGIEGSTALPWDLLVSSFGTGNPSTPGEGPSFYDRADYQAYFSEWRGRSEREGFEFADLESIVPSEHWGRTNEGRTDMFHFKDYGHRQLAGAIDALIATPGN
jgi:hypothetical protein